MGLSRTVKFRRRLVKRLVMAELIARRGEGPLALRSGMPRLRARPVDAARTSGAESQERED